MSGKDLRDLPNLSVHQLLYVREAARAPTWTDAAHRLGVSQPALSQGVAEVERRLGVALFERRSRVRKPTPALALVLEVADRIIAATDDLDQRIHELETGQRGHLRVGMIDTAALGMFAVALAEFRSSHPDVTTTLVVDSSGPLSQGVVSGHLDLAIVVAPNPILLRTPTSFHIEALVAEQMYVYPPFGLPKASNTWGPDQWGPWVTYPTGSQSRELIERALLHRGSSTTAVAESSNPDVLRQMVRLGVGWCVLPKNIAEAGSDPLKPLKGPPLTERSMALIRRSNALFHSAANDLAQLLSDAAR
jgi:DNA-binding transcriptional LysR family regulator